MMKKQIFYITSLLLALTFVVAVVPEIAVAQCEDGVETSIDLTGDGTCVPKDSGDNIAENPIIKLIAQVVRFLSVGVGIVVTISIVVAGIQYMASQGNPQAIQAAQSRLTNAIIALILFIFMTTIINFLIPGGLF